jgi:hypothetical protein
VIERILPLTLSLAEEIKRTQQETEHTFRKRTALQKTGHLHPHINFSIQREKVGRD